MKSWIVTNCSTAVAIMPHIRIRIICPYSISVQRWTPQPTWINKKVGVVLAKKNRNNFWFLSCYPFVEFSPCFSVFCVFFSYFSWFGFFFSGIMTLVMVYPFILCMCVCVFVPKISIEYWIDANNKSSVLNAKSNRNKKIHQKLSFAICIHSVLGGCLFVFSLCFYTFFLFRFYYHF